VLTPDPCAVIPLLFLQHYWYDMLAHAKHSEMIKETETQLPFAMTTSMQQSLPSNDHSTLPSAFFSHFS
jgi:hypothetical protein